MGLVYSERALPNDLCCHVAEHVRVCMCGVRYGCRRWCDAVDGAVICFVL